MAGKIVKVKKVVIKERVAAEYIKVAQVTKLYMFQYDFNNPLVAIPPITLSDEQSSESRTSSLESKSTLQWIRHGTRRTMGNDYF